MNRLTHQVYEELTNAGLDARDLYGDGARLHFIRRTSRARKIPPFALNDCPLRLVLAVRVWRSLYGAKPVPPDVLCYWSALDKKMTARYAQRKPRGRGGCGDALFIPHSYLCGQVALAYGAWRRRRQNQDLAAEYGISVRYVEKSLKRIVEIAQELGLDTGDWVRPSAAVLREKRHPYWKKHREWLHQNPERWAEHTKKNTERTKRWKDSRSTEKVIADRLKDRDRMRRVRLSKEKSRQDSLRRVWHAQLLSSASNSSDAGSSDSP